MNALRAQPAWSGLGADHSARSQITDYLGLSIHVTLVFSSTCIMHYIDTMILIYLRAAVTYAIVIFCGSASG